MALDLEPGRVFVFSSARGSDLASRPSSLDRGRGPAGQGKRRGSSVRLAGCGGAAGAQPAATLPLPGGSANLAHRTHELPSGARERTPGGGRASAWGQEEPALELVPRMADSRAVVASLTASTR